MIIRALERELWLVLLVTAVVVAKTSAEVLWTKMVGKGELRCDQLVAEVSQQEREVQVIQPPILHGKWVSREYLDSHLKESGGHVYVNPTLKKRRTSSDCNILDDACCEIRPGPEYLLRRYQFGKNSSVSAVQFYYDDQSCTRPKYSIIAEGKIRTREQSWTTPGATEAEYILQSVRVVSYSQDMAEIISRKVNRSCPGYVMKPWRAFREYSLYRYVESKTTDNRYGVEVVEDIDCLSALSWTIHELQLLKQERRASRHSGTRVPQMQLLLGDIHTRLRSREEYRPTAFQAPLLKANQAYGCHVCHIVGKSNLQSPPHLPAKPRLPVYLAGEWLSQRCEVRSQGLFVTRRFRFFSSSSHRWLGLYQYYADSRCSVPTYNVIAKGTYQEGGPSSKVDGATKFDFKVSNVVITPQDQWTASSLNGHKGDICGNQGSWRIDEPQDVTSTYGCRGLGIKVPSLEYDLVKMELDPHGTPLLFLGLPDTSNRRYTSKNRPTAYQKPLMQCSVSPFLGMRDLDPNPSNHLHPVLNARFAKVTSGSSVLQCHHLVLLLPLWFLLTN